MLLRLALVKGQPFCCYTVFLNSGMVGGKQILPLAQAGFRVIALDGRGYGESSKPQQVSQYSLSNLVSDLIAVTDQLGRSQVFLVGHDWGALVAWCAAGWHPERFTRLAILNVPHPAVIRRFLLTRPRQLIRSWYMFFFQLPRVPEWIFRRRNFEAGIRSLRETSLPGTFTETDLSQYRAAWSVPGSVTAMINWYRALFRTPSASRVGMIDVPTLILWGKQDRFLLPSLAPASLKLCRRGRLLWFENATHWLQHEDPAGVNAALLDFLSTGQLHAE